MNLVEFTSKKACTRSNCKSKQLGKDQLVSLQYKDLNKDQKQKTRETTARCVQSVGGKPHAFLAKLKIF